MKVKVLAAVLVLGAFFTSASAQTIKEKGKNQRHRIAQGVKSGELTKKETKNLAKDQREIRQDVKQAKADGIVTAAEKKISARIKDRPAEKFIAKNITTGIEINPLACPNYLKTLL